MFRLGKKNFSEGPPPPVKGKIFDTRFGLIHVRTGKNFFYQGTPNPPPPPGIARNCYGHAAGGMPLAFTQEDFLVNRTSKYSVFYYLSYNLATSIMTVITDRVLFLTLKMKGISPSIVTFQRISKRFQKSLITERTLNTLT